MTQNNEEKLKAIKFWVTESEKKKINVGASLSGMKKGDFFKHSLLEKSESLIKLNLNI